MGVQIGGGVHVLYRPRHFAHSWSLFSSQVNRVELWVYNTKKTEDLTNKVDVLGKFTELWIATMLWRHGVIKFDNCAGLSDILQSKQVKRSAHEWINKFIITNLISVIISIIHSSDEWWKTSNQTSVQNLNFVWEYCWLPVPGGVRISQVYWFA